jgi:hypothetical protein
MTVKVLPRMSFFFSICECSLFAVVPNSDQSEKKKELVVPNSDESEKKSGRQELV